MYKVIEVADKLNVSKVTVYNKLKEYSKELKPYVKKLKGVTYIETKGLEIIKESLEPVNQINDNDTIDKEKDTNKADNMESVKEFKELTITHINDLKEQIETLRSELNIKNKQLENKDKLLENMQVLLKQQQEKTLLLEEKKPSIWERIFKKNR